MSPMILLFCGGDSITGKGAEISGNGLTVFYAFTWLMPASIRTASSLMSAAVISPASPHAEMIISAFLVIYLIPSVKISQAVTVA